MLRQPIQDTPTSTISRRAPMTQYKWTRCYTTNVDLWHLRNFELNNTEFAGYDFPIRQRLRTGNHRDQEHLRFRFLNSCR